MNKDWSKQFDDRFVVDGSFKVQGNYIEVKDFIKETINALCDELKMKKVVCGAESGHSEAEDSYAFEEKGYNQAVEELNKKLESIRNENN